VAHFERFAVFFDEGRNIGFAFALLQTHNHRIAARTVAFVGDENAGCAPALAESTAMPIYRPTPIEPEQAECTRKLVEESRELLKQSAPDTFAGRKTQEPFPKEEEEDTFSW